MPPFPGQVNAGQQARFAPPPVGWQHPSQTPQLGSWRSADGGSRTGRGRRWIGIWLVYGFFGLNFLVGGLIGLGVAAYHYYEYQVGTPTTATIDDCVASRSSVTCYGTWSVGGVSQTAEIRGVPSGPSEGQSLDVHVSGGKAYTADSVGGVFYLAIFTGILGIVLGVGLLRAAWRYRR